MAYEQDYIMRMIKEMVRALMSVLLKKRFHELDLEEKAEITGDDETKELFVLADTGKINEAENLLLENVDFSNPRFIQEAMAFYEHINEYDDEFLEEHNYTREEIVDGLKDILNYYGLSGMFDMR